MNSAAEELLGLWERAAAAGPSGRDDALLSGPDGAAPRSLGARNAALLGLRAQLFGPAQLLRCNCPRCAAAAEFAIDCQALSQTLLPAADALAGTHNVDHGAYHLEFRLPDAADLREAAERSEDDAAFEQALIDRCILACTRRGESCDVDELPAELTQLLSARMEALEPGASLSFELACPACSHGWMAAMDVGAVLWSELQTRAERLLLDVDALARAYGWNEAQVFALSPVRRAAYLQLAGAAR